MKSLSSSLRWALSESHRPKQYATHGNASSWHRRRRSTAAKRCYRSTTLEISSVRCNPTASNPPLACPFWSHSRSTAVQRDKKNLAILSVDQLVVIVQLNALFRSKICLPDSCKNLLAVQQLNPHVETFQRGDVFDPQRLLYCFLYLRNLCSTSGWWRAHALPCSNSSRIERDRTWFLASFVNFVIFAIIAKLCFVLFD